MDAVNREKLARATELLLEVLEATKTGAPVTASSGRKKIAWGKTKSDAFNAGVLWIEEQLGVSANNLMACMKFESDLNPKAKNPQSSATGLIQFMDATVASMKKTYPKLGTLFPSINKARDLAELTDLQQLTWVYYYFKPFGGQSRWSVADTYMAILLPSMIGAPLDAKMAWNDNAYRVNAGLDLNRDRIITKREASARVLKLFDMGMTEEFFG